MQLFLSLKYQKNSVKTEKERSVGLPSPKWGQVLQVEAAFVNPTGFPEPSAFSSHFHNDYDVHVCYQTGSTVASAQDCCKLFGFT